ncbi:MULTISPECIES: hypothetical protein [Protofrankia]|uniref:Uncharacterized protein n=1 Tax=Candidatus Protofrankia datiscae TaxID=2716812 RepID=F8B0L3_9ACTN|nr:MULTISPECIES: hypothetical protein [Protofrankia]AEH09772.1 hypothetical protein FsymDg_2387 [Candidatus Protofrankia datiscae]
MGLGKDGAEPGPAAVEQVVRILEEYVGGLPTTDPDEPHTVTFVRTWTLTRTLGEATPSAASAPAAGAPSAGAPSAIPLSAGALAPGGAPLRVGGTVVRWYAAQDDHADRADRADEVDDQRTYEQLVGAAQALAARGFPSEEVYEGWRTVAIDLPASAVPVAAPVGKDQAGSDQVGSDPAEKKAGKKRRLWWSTTVTT